LVRLVLVLVVSRDGMVDVLVTPTTLVGRALEQHPEAALEMVKQGHEVASHGYRWIDYQYVDEETERQDAQKVIQAIEKVIQKSAPPLFVSKASSPRVSLTVEFLF